MLPINCNYLKKLENRTKKEFCRILYCVSSVDVTAQLIRFKAKNIVKNGEKVKKKLLS